MRDGPLEIRIGIEDGFTEDAIEKAIPGGLVPRTLGTTYQSFRGERTRRQAIAGLRMKLNAAAVKALARAAEEVKVNVVNLTPLWTGGLRQNVKDETEDNGHAHVIYGEGVVFQTHELNASWSRLPPHQRIRAWVEGKLGISGNEGERVTWKVKQKIKASGLTLPNAEFLGQMIQRTKDQMEVTDFHFKMFSNVFKEELRRI